MGEGPGVSADGQKKVRHGRTFEKVGKPILLKPSFGRVADKEGGFFFVLREFGIIAVTFFGFADPCEDDAQADTCNDEQDNGEIGKTEGVRKDNVFIIVCSLLGSRGLLNDFGNCVMRRCGSLIFKGFARDTLSMNTGAFKVFINSHI